MKKKQPKIQIISPFPNLHNNWEMITQIESSLNKYLTNPHIHVNLESDDHQVFSRQSLDVIVKSISNVLGIVQKIRAEQKNIEQIKQNSRILQEKIEKDELAKQNYENNYLERVKMFVDENRMLKETNEKMKKHLNQTENNHRHAIEELKSEGEQLKQKYLKMQNENKKLLLYISQLQQDIKSCKDKIYRLTSAVEKDQKQLTLFQKVEQLEDIKRKFKKGELKEINLFVEKSQSSLEKMSKFDIVALSKLVSYLTPKQICLVMSLNKQLRLMILKSKICMFQLSKAVGAVKNKKIKYYHRHIEYFQKLFSKIPQEILQLTYFKYHILKDNVGSEIMGIMNSSATIFQGKFIEGQELYAGISQDAIKALNYKIKPGEAHILEVDLEIIKDYEEDRKQQRQKLAKLFETMYNKISNTYLLYRADLQSSTSFIENILKHFSKVFVLSKNLYIEAQNLQKLNNFLLNELNKWDRMEIDKNLQLEDLRAELQAQKKLKLFFTDKSIKSQQKALIQQNLKLTFEMKHNRLIDTLNVTCAQKEQQSKKNQLLTKSSQHLTHQNKQIRKKYQRLLEQHNKIKQQLIVVKETIIKMNIV